MASPTDPMDSALLFEQQQQPSNAKSLAIFGGYMLAALLLTMRCAAVIRGQYLLNRKLSPRSTPVTVSPSSAKLEQKEDKDPGTSTIDAAVATSEDDNSLLSAAQLRRRIIIFSALAAASLATTWYYMFAFFAHSYRDWAVSRGGAVVGGELQLGAWLKDTSLFSLAWGSAMASDARVWWTQQIFGFCAVWSLLVGTEGSLRQIRTLWPFILLGQIVAISFASNLSFIAMIVSPRIPKEPLKGRAKWNANSRLVDPATFWAYAIVGVTFASAAAILPSSFPVAGSAGEEVTGKDTTATGGGGGRSEGGYMSEPWFLPLLLTPHVLAFAPLLLKGSIRSARQLAQPSLIAVVMAILLQARTTGNVLENGGGWAEITAAFWEHPAVSSVGWDVVMCWISFSCWSYLRD